MTFIDALIGYLPLLTLFLVIVAAVFWAVKEDYAICAEAERQDELISDLMTDMYSDPVFSQWADRFGLSYGESVAAWEAYKLGRSAREKS